MKILFVKPPVNPNLLTITRYEPLEFEYLAASVKEHEVEILDMRIRAEKKNLMKKLDAFKPDLVGTTAYTVDVNASKNILKEIKKYNSRIKTIIGGHHATFMPSDFAEGYIDTIFIGYADKSFREYINTFEEGGDLESVKNIAFIRGNKLILTKRESNFDINALPTPARHLTRDYWKKYHDPYGKKTGLIMTSRGCPFQCTFCACWKLMDGKYVTRDVKSVIEEMKNMPDEAEYIDVSDDNTLHNVKHAWELSEMIKKHNISRKLKMYARSNTIVKHPDLIESLREAGLRHLTVGIEAIKDEDLKELKKGTSVKMNDEAIRILKKLGIYIDAHFVIKPESTVKDFAEILQYVYEKSLFRTIFAVLTPLPGTKLYADNEHRFALRDYELFDFAHSILPTRLSRKEFYRQLANLYRKSYSWIRCLKFKISNLWKHPEITEDSYAYNTDGFSVLQLLLINILAIPYYFKFRNLHKSEILL